MKLPPLPRRREAAPLALALLAAVLLHGLWLAELQLRQRRQPQSQRLQRPDDTPELLVFSRQPPEALGLETVPLPPPSAMPPPPPLLPDQRGPGKTSAPVPGQAPPARAASGNRPSPPGRPGIDRQPAPRPASRPLPRQGSRPGPPPLPPLPPLAPLEALQEARARGAEATPPLAGEGLQRWRVLWQSAEAGRSPPVALASRPAAAELRHLPLAQARAQGLEPESGRPLRLDDDWLLPWIDGELLWLLWLPG
jgi:hypothetical protein